MLKTNMTQVGLERTLIDCEWQTVKETPYQRTCISKNKISVGDYNGHLIAQHPYPQHPYFLLMLQESTIFALYNMYYFFDVSKKTVSPMLTLRNKSHEIIDLETTEIFVHYNNQIFYLNLDLLTPQFFLFLSSEQHVLEFIQQLQNRCNTRQSESDFFIKLTVSDINHIYELSNCQLNGLKTEPYLEYHESLRLFKKFNGTQYPIYDFQTYSIIPIWEGEWAQDEAISENVLETYQQKDRYLIDDCSDYNFVMIDNQAVCINYCTTYSRKKSGNLDPLSYQNFEKMMHLHLEQTDSKIKTLSTIYTIRYIEHNIKYDEIQNSHLDRNIIEILHFFRKNQLSLTLYDLNILAIIQDYVADGNIEFDENTHPYLTILLNAIDKNNLFFLEGLLSVFINGLPAEIYSKLINTQIKASQSNILYPLLMYVALSNTEHTAPTVEILVKYGANNFPESKDAKISFRNRHQLYPSKLPGISFFPPNDNIFEQYHQVKHQPIKIKIQEETAKNEKNSHSRVC
ncbi:MAG: hypothetical protein Q8R83_01065 [Legionellaceae bacterium]|nr:hypothetical protein [Legionellaceae bacterium]